MCRDGTLRVVLCEGTFGAPSAQQSAALVDARPRPQLSPRDVIATLLTALHKSNLDTPRLRFGAEVVLRFLAPTNPASRVTAERFSQYLMQSWYDPLLSWSEYKWHGDTVFLSDGNEAYQQVVVRAAPDEEWTSVRWILSLAQSEWRVESVFVQEPDGDEALADIEGRLEFLGSAHGTESPTQVVAKVMRALRNLDEPRVLHGAEIAIRFCSPTNAASRLSPRAFAQYLQEPWYRILTEWDEMQLEDDDDDDGDDSADDSSVVEQSVLVKRTEDESWSVVNWQLSRHSGRWLIGALTITE